jgi:ferritin
MLSKKVQKELNNQVNAEIYSAYLYLSMSSYCETLSLGGFANWMRVQFQEEMSHGLKIFDYINERGGQALLSAIDKPETSWKNIVDVFENVVKHEKLVTSLIHKLVEVARSEKDYATENMLQWFVNEQVEEEANAEQLLEDVKRIDGKGQGLLMLDRELRQRVFTDETKEE